MHADSVLLIQDGTDMAMKPKKKTTPKIVPIIPPVVGAVVGRAALGAAAKAAAKRAVDASKIVKRKATGPKDEKGLTKMKKALSTSKGPNRTTPASRPLTKKEKGLTGGNLPRQLMKKKNQPRKVFP
jgi:hypothetical protein